MPKSRRIEDLEYLTIEGGGGLGVAYLGAVWALEQFKVLPLKFESHDKPNQIKGISGSSAGAITALFIALGFNVNEIAYFGNILGKTLLEPPELKKSHVCRRINNDFKADEWGFRPYSRGLLTDFLFSKKKNLLNKYILLKLHQSDFPKEVQEFIESHFEEFAYELVFSGGLYKGLLVRKIFNQIVHYAFSKPYTALSKIDLKGHEYAGEVLTFKLFKEITKINLVFTGTNITEHVPVLFSADRTPDMLVTEAVGISMNIPPAFKPIWSEMDVLENDYVINREHYVGWFIDGGILNNLPLHVFDDPNSTKLNPNVLAIRTIPPVSDDDKMTPPVEDNFSWWVATNWYDTTRFSANAGQLRTPEESLQTIELNTKKLSVFNFSPTMKIKEEPIKLAAQDTYKYFGKPFDESGKPFKDFQFSLFLIDDCRCNEISGRIAKAGLDQLICKEVPNK